MTDKVGLFFLFQCHNVLWISVCLLCFSRLTWLVFTVSPGRRERIQQPAKSLWPNLVHAESSLTSEDSVSWPVFAHFLTQTQSHRFSQGTWVSVSKYDIWRPWSESGGFSLLLGWSLFLGFFYGLALLLPRNLEDTENHIACWVMQPQLSGWYQMPPS